jgi:hypothetical protein
VRRRVQPESIVIVGDSRPLFDLDLDELEKGLGKRPVQISLAGSCAYPILADLGNDRERRMRMIEKCARPGELQTRIQQIWLPLFTPPPPPSYVPKEVLMEQMGKAVEARFRDTVAVVNKLRDRGGKIVFVRFPHGGELKNLEDRLSPRAKIWDPLIQSTAAPGIYYSDFPELSGFNCPEWSHLSAGDSVEFTKRLVPHLRTALQL